MRPVIGALIYLCCILISSKTVALVSRYQEIKVRPIGRILINNNKLDICNVPKRICVIICFIVLSVIALAATVK